jgi:hypothetical protein
MKQKIGLRLGAAACLAFLVAACGGGNGTNSNSNSGDAQVSQPQRADYPVKVMVQAPPASQTLATTRAARSHPMKVAPRNRRPNNSRRPGTWS